MSQTYQTGYGTVLPNVSLSHRSTIFVQYGTFSRSNKEKFQPLTIWYATCSAIISVMHTKQTNSHSSVDQNWHWPEKTWFRERLQAVKSQQEQRRRPIVSGRISAPVTAESQSKTDGLKIA